MHSAMVFGCFPCPQLEVGKITHWNNVISSTGQGSVCMACTECEDGAYKRHCTECHDAVCQEPDKVVVEFYTFLLLYSVLVLGIFLFYVLHFYKKK